MILAKLIQEVIHMSQDLSTLPCPQVPAALTEYSRDPLGFMTHCAREFGEMVP